MLYTFYTETHCNSAYHVGGKVVQFRRGYFATEDKAMADALLPHCKAWELSPSWPGCKEGPQTTEPQDKVGPVAIETVCSVEGGDKVGAPAPIPARERIKRRTA